ncbi:hypothetical protein H7347_06925 [Corynebacterium sp. zg-331]|uniref:hypothetical protein n=1 Tax=unclassified Corynebacterium TaxID=2624378 RepID=UPI0016434C76|nr:MULTISPECIES: hypothetical protein [unclassified Corynebacterium]MBC3186305.1 hypothetical protein [Corynebacterium sp. zg-331]
MSEMDPDTWWASLPTTRKEQIHRWISTPTYEAMAPGQLPFWDEEDVSHGD